MLRCNSAASKSGPATVLALGNPDAAAGSLADAGTEVAALRGIYGGAGAKILTGREASEPTFKSQAGKYGTLHIAAHAVLDDANPMYSYLALARGGTGAGDDGLLEAREMLNLNLKAELVVLAACDTARGRLRVEKG